MLDDAAAHILVLEALSDRPCLAIVCRNDDVDFPDLICSWRLCGERVVVENRDRVCALFAEVDRVPHVGPKVAPGDLDHGVDLHRRYARLNVEDRGLSVTLTGEEGAGRKE